MRLSMLRKILYIATVCLFTSAAAFAQTGTLSGTVTDAESGETLPGANVLIVELQRGASTDTNGEFTVENIPAGEYNIRISFVGYQNFTRTVQINAGQTTEINAEMQPGAVGLDELVVTGYGTTTKRELTGSIASVSSEDFEGVPVQNTEAILQGRAAGVTVTTTSGNPGGAFQVQIRGNGSINAASEPLYIVDGVQISFDQQSNLTSQSPLNSIAPGDIESIEVIKGASAAAIYGSQAANGVVLITTKRGQSGATNISVRAQTGISGATQRVDYINTEQYLDFVGEGWALNAGVTPVGDAGLAEGGSYIPYRDAYESFFRGFFGSPEWGDAEIEQYNAWANNVPGVALPDGALANTDWQDFIYDQGVTQQYRVSADGGNESTRFFISGRWEQTDGHIFNSKFDAIGVRSNFDHQFSDKFNASLNLNLSQTNQFGVCQDGNFINCPPSQAMFEAPMSFPFFANNGYSTLTRFGTSNNPAVIRDEVDRNVQVISILSNLNLNYQFTDWLNMNATAGVDYRNTEDERYETPIADPGVGGSLSYDYRNVYNFTTNATLNARYTFDDVHNVSGFVGTEYRRNYWTQVVTAGEGFPGSFFRVLNASSSPVQAEGTNSEFRIGSYFGTAKYNFDEKYFAAVTARYDGHSRFGSETRWGFFPSISGAWRVSEEDFFNVDFVNELKLRIGYGVVGNAAIGNFASQGLYSALGSYSGTTALTPTQLANVNLSWEEAKEINIGLDFEVLEGRISGAVDVYRRDNDNLLLDRELPVESGFSDITENVGSIRNEGVELELSSVNVNTGDFIWQSRFNVGALRNEVLDLGDDDVLNENSTFQEIRVGQAIGVIQVPRWAGVNPADGRPMWYDADGNITYTPNSNDDSINYKDGVANYTGGFGNTFNYKGLQLDVFLQFSFGKWAFANTDWYFTRTPDFLMNLDEMVLDRWRVPGDVTYFPRAHEAGTDFNETSNFRTTLGTHSIYNASYIRLKNVSLSYNLPASLTEKLNLRGLRLFANGLNLATWTAWPFYDPEVADGTNDIYGNLVAASYPTGLQINGGIEVQF